MGRRATDKAWAERFLLGIRGRSIPELCDAAGVSYDTLNSALRKGQSPNVEMCLRIAREANLQPEWIWLGEGGKEPVAYADPFIGREVQTIQAIIDVLSQAVGRAQAQAAARRAGPAAKARQVSDEAVDSARKAARRRKRDRGHEPA